LPSIAKDLQVLVVLGAVLAPQPARGEAPALPDTARAALDSAYGCRNQGDLACAERELRAARAAGADPQRVALELAYVDLARGDLGSARPHLERAASGSDPTLATQARVQLDAVTPPRVSADLYADAYGWVRPAGGHQTSDLVPTLRLRALFRPVLDWDLQPYVYAQGTRDLRSRGADAAGVPQIYADDYALFGVGLLARFFDRKLGAFAQIGPAVNLLDDGRERTVSDARAGLLAVLEMARCRPHAGGARLHLLPCAEGYGEGVYVNRFDHNVIGFARARAGATWAVTGPVAWQLLAEARGAVDRNADYWNNFVDGGLGPRWRLLGAVPLDLFAGVHAGRYTGRDNVDPLPDPRWYADVRLLASTYMEF